jgi:hypothetical protein
MANEKKAIEYHTESVYGQPKNYYNDEEVGEHMRALTGQKTLHPSHIEHLKALGHDVKEVPVTADKMESGKWGAHNRGTSDGKMVTHK